MFLDLSSAPTKFENNLQKALHKSIKNFEIEVSLNFDTYRKFQKMFHSSVAERRPKAWAQRSEFQIFHIPPSKIGKVEGGEFAPKYEG